MIMHAYSYGTPIRVWDIILAHTRMGRPIRVWDVPYAYGPIYAYGAEQNYHAAPTSRSAQIIKVSRRMRSDTFKRKFSFTAIILTEKFILLLKARH